MPFTAPTFATPTLQVGRVGLDATLSHPYEMSQSSSTGPNTHVETIAIQGRINNSTLAQAQALRSEILALAGRVVPITSTLDPRVDGYYLIEGMSLDVVREYDPYAQGIYPFSIQATRYLGVGFELALGGGLIPNAHSIVTAANKGFVGVGEASSLRWTVPPSGSVAYTDLETTDGTVRCFYQLDPDDYGMRFSILPADYYKAACSVWVNSRLRSSHDITFSTPTATLLLNNLCGIDIGTSSVVVAHYVDGAWTAGKTYTLVAPGATNLNGAWTGTRILRNDPEMAVIQLYKSRTSTGLGRLVLTVSIYRGWRMIVCRLSSDVVDSLGVERTEAEAGSALASGEGIVASAADGAGDKYLVVSPDAHSTTNLATTAGIALTAPATTITFAIGAVMNSATPDTGADTQNLVDQFFNYIEPRQQPIFGAI